MSEFKQIPDAPDYKINKEGEVYRANGTPVFILGAGKVLLKKPDGNMEHFIVEDLVKKIFLGLDSTISIGMPKPHIVDFAPSPEPNIMVDEEKMPSVDAELSDEIKHTEENNTNESEDNKLVKEEDVIEEVKNEKVKSKKSSSDKPIKPIVEKIKRGRGRPKSPQLVYASNKTVETILSLKCSASIKIWKLSEVGCEIPEILFHLKQTSSQAHSARGIICRYRNSKKLKDKASLIK